MLTLLLNSQYLYLSQLRKASPNLLILPVTHGWTSCVIEVLPFATGVKVSGRCAVVSPSVPELDQAHEKTETVGHVKRRKRYWKEW